MKFDVEWLEAPGVRDRVLAATWARLQITANDANVIELVHQASHTRRLAVYGSVFPLVEWLVENWWHVLNEPSQTSPLEPGRRAPKWKLPWVQRHNLLAAREGTALPDAAFMRDGDEIVVCWFPDGNESGESRVRFLGNGLERVGVADFENAATALVKATFERLRAIVGDDEILVRTSEAWREITTADTSERELCRSLALLGVDPYDPDEATDTLVDLVERSACDLPAALFDDLLEGSRPTGLQAAVTWLQTNRGTLAEGTANHSYPTLTSPWAPSAHQTGYSLARESRTKLFGIDSREAINDLEELVVDQLGWDANPVRISHNGMDLEGLVGISAQTEKPVIIDPGSREGWARRFLLARSAFFTVTGTLGQGRLLTRAVTRSQRASRAFAAELLAPASALAERAGGIVSSDEVTALCEEFGVNPLLIEHQLLNHGIGTISA